MVFNQNLKDMNNFEKQKKKANIPEERKKKEKGTFLWGGVAVLCDELMKNKVRAPRGGWRRRPTALTRKPSISPESQNPGLNAYSAVERVVSSPPDANLSPLICELG